MIPDSKRGAPTWLPGNVGRAIFLAFVLVAVLLVFPQLVGVLLLVLLVVIVAVPLSRAATLLERYRIPRAIGAPISLIAALAVLAGIIALLVPAFVHEGRQLVDALPNTVHSLQEKLPRSKGHGHGSGDSLKTWINGYTEHPRKLLGPAATVGTTLATILAGAIAVLLTAVFSAVRPEPLREGVTRLVPPPRRPDLERLLDRLAEAYLGWLRGLLVGMVVLWLVTYAGLAIVGLPYAVVFATVTALAMVVPYFGALLSAVPPVLYALTISPTKAIFVALVYVVAHFVEGDLISPLVMARAVKIPPALVAVGVLAVERLLGIAGLLVAVPVIVTVKLAVEELWVRPMETAYASAGADRLLSPAEARADRPSLADQRQTPSASRPPVAADGEKSLT
jgi:predicted PurR-regulated permease PerM